MESVVSTMVGFWWLIPIIGLIAAYKHVLRFFFGVVIIPEDSIGIINKKFVLFGANKTLPDGAIVALKGEAGVQADALPPGLHFGYWPWQYAIVFQKFITVEQGKVGVVSARDGAPLHSGRVLAKSVDCDSFQDARGFLTKGGQRGPQIAIIPPGTYRINTELFTVDQFGVLDIEDNMVGVVTAKDGAPLQTGEIAGKEVGAHSSYQDGEAFIANGGHRGLQEQVLLAGRYFINPLFATVEVKPMTVVAIANAGVVVSFVGETGVDLSGAAFLHGNQVAKGQKGVWADPYDPGKYPVNPYTHKVESVSTANIVLNWANNKTESHNLDANLSSIKIRSSDGFTMTADVSVIIHIPRNDAPKVIARFGSVLNLVTQVLEPLISNWFRNSAQSSDAIAFLNGRQKIQQLAKEAIATALAAYNVVGVDTLIGDINPPAELMKTLTDRKIAEQEQITFGTQRAAAEEQQKLNQAQAMAATQSHVVNAERSVQIADYQAQAQIKKADGDAKAKTVNAGADAEVLRIVGAAEGEKITAVGNAEASVIKLKTEAEGQLNHALMDITRSLASKGVPLVPTVMVGGGGDGKNGGSLLDVVVANIVHQQLMERQKQVGSKELLAGETK